MSSDSSSTTADRPVQLRSAQASTDDPKAKLPEVASSAATPEEHNDALTQRLEDATESALLSSTSSRRAVLEEAGFSEELKARLLEKISATSSVGVDSASISSTTTQIPASAGQGTRDLATAAPWAGEESTADTVLRMLQDKHKPLPVHERGKFQIPTPRGVTRRESFRSPGHRAASARDRAAQYAEEKAEQEAAVVAAAAAADAAGAGKGLSEEEQQALRREFKERFRPEARIMPATFTGLAELANKRIEDAIARGQFKNIPRGKGVERDARADNPFIDTVGCGPDSASLV